MECGECNMWRWCVKVWLVVLLVVNVLIVDVTPSPAHRTRHRHQRHINRCDISQSLDHPHEGVCGKRVKRDIHQMNVREAENATLCEYRICEDIDPERTPQEIHRVHCLERGCQCQQEGSYHCTQLMDEVEVWYAGVSHTIDVEVGCVCASKLGVRLSNHQPHSVDR